MLLWFKREGRNFSDHSGDLKSDGCCILDLPEYLDDKSANYWNLKCQKLLNKLSGKMLAHHLLLVPVSLTMLRVVI